MEPCAWCGGWEEHQYLVGGMDVGGTSFGLSCVPLAAVAKGLGWNVAPLVAAKEILLSSYYAGKELFANCCYVYFHCCCCVWGVVDDAYGVLHRRQRWFACQTCTV